MTDNPQADRPFTRADSRRRVTLPKEAAEPGQMFIIDVRDDGGIVLLPAVAVPLGSLAVTSD